MIGELCLDRLLKTHGGFLRAIFLKPAAKVYQGWRSFSLAPFLQGFKTTWEECQGPGGLLINSGCAYSLHGYFCWCCCKPPGRLPSPYALLYPCEVTHKAWWRPRERFFMYDSRRSSCTRPFNVKILHYSWQSLWPLTVLHPQKTNTVLLSASRPHRHSNIVFYSRNCGFTCPWRRPLRLKTTLEAEMKGPMEEADRKGRGSLKVRRLNSRRGATYMSLDYHYYGLPMAKGDSLLYTVSLACED